MKLSSIRYGMLALGMAIGVAQAAHARPPSVPLEDPETFEMAFDLSFFLDVCGDRPLGELFRRALQERFAHCPFSDAARKKFQTSAIEAHIKFSKDMQQYIAKFGRLPERIDDDPTLTCQGRRASAPYLTTRELLNLYGEGKISAETIVSDPCDVPPGAL